MRHAEPRWEFHWKQVLVSCRPPQGKLREAEKAPTLAPKPQTPFDEGAHQISSVIDSK
jgi:hypothetical protein